MHARGARMKSFNTENERYTENPEKLLFSIILTLKQINRMQ